MKPVGDFFLTEFAALPRIGSRDWRSAETRQKEDDNKTEPEEWRSERVELETEEGIVWTAANVRGCVVIKFAAANVQAGREWIGNMLLREGSIEKQFGEDALMCVQ